MPRGPVVSRYPHLAPHHPNLAVLLSALDAGALDLARHGMNYKTAHGLLHGRKDPALRTAHLAVAALRSIASSRTQAGGSSVPIEAITVETVFPLHRLPSSLRVENIRQATPKSKS